MASRMVNQPTAFAATSRRLKRQRMDSNKYLKFIRTLPCTVTGTWGVEAAHVSYEDLRYGKLGRGMGAKEEDCWAVPLCISEHKGQHAMGDERSYWNSYEIDPCRVALALWRCFQINDYETALLILERARD